MRKVIAILLLLCAIAVADDDMCFLRGDANGDGDVDAADITTISMYLNSQNPTIHDNLDALDANDDGEIDVADPVYLSGMLYLSYTWYPPNDTTGTAFDPTDDDINPYYTWEDGEVPGEWPECNPASLADASPREEWPYQAYSDWDPDTKEGNYWLVATTSATDDELENVALGTWTTDSGTRESFYWASFANFDCGASGGIELDWKAYFYLSAAISTQEYGLIVMEIDASEAVLTVTLRNTDLSESGYLQKTVDFGHYGLACASMPSSSNLFPAPSYYDNWDNDAPSGPSVWIIHGPFQPTGSTLFDWTDIYGTETADWATDDVVEMWIVSLSNVRLIERFPSSPTDASTTDTLEFRVAFDDPEMVIDYD